MHAVLMHHTGGPQVLRLEAVPDLRAGPGELLVRVGAAGVNYTDVLARQGVSMLPGDAPQLPQVLGTEVAGIVVGVGEGVAGFDEGDRVCAFVRGGYADHAVADPGLTFHLPDAVGFPEGVGLLVQGLTSLHLLRDTGRLAPGETVLVHSAAGGVGSLLVQLARHLGAGTVVATAGGPAKAERVRALGADTVLDYQDAGWADRVREATGGRGCDLVLEAVGGDVAELSLGLLAPFGRLVSYGVASKQLAQFAGSQLMHANQSVSGYWLQGRLHDRLAVDCDLALLLGLVEDGTLTVHVEHAYPLAEAATAHRDLAARRTTGKVVLVP